jgi:hypothetical protein
MILPAITVGCLIGLLFSIQKTLKIRHQKKLLLEDSNASIITAPSAHLNLPISVIGTSLTYNLKLTSDNLLSDSCYLRLEHFDQAVQFCNDEGVLLTNI